MSQTTPPVMLVTAGARRVGAAIGRGLHARGAHLVIHHRNSGEHAAALAAELEAVRPDSTTLVRGDLSEDGVPEALIEQIIARHGRLDALVNNASSFFPTPLGTIDASDWLDLIGSNLKGPLFLSQAAAPHLGERTGAIVNIIDIHADRPLKGYPLYCAAKAGLSGLTRALALELGPRIRVNGVSPGPIEWPDDGQFDAPERRRIIDHTLLKREGEPADVARSVAFLIFDAPYVTGQILAVDGGRSAHL